MRSIKEIGCSSGLVWPSVKKTRCSHRGSKPEPYNSCSRCNNYAILVPCHIYMYIYSLHTEFHKSSINSSCSYRLQTESCRKYFHSIHVLTLLPSKKLNIFPTSVAIPNANGASVAQVCGTVSRKCGDELSYNGKTFIPRHCKINHRRLVEKSKRHTHTHTHSTVVSQANVLPI